MINRSFLIFVKKLTDGCKNYNLYFKQSTVTSCFHNNYWSNFFFHINKVNVPRTQIKE